MRLDFYYDVVCPYAYMASQQVEAIAARTGAELRWHPVLLGGIYRSIAAPDVPANIWAASKQLVGLRDIHRSAEARGIPLRFHPAHPRRSVNAMRLILGAPSGQRVALSHALFAAYWVQGRDIADASVLADIATEHGVDPAVIGRTETKAALFAATQAAVDAGAFGVPTMCVGDRLWFGQDRLHLVEAALGGTPPRWPTAPAHDGLARRVDFFHDFASPFSYLAATQLDALCSRESAALHWRPILLGALFRAIGTPNVPMFAMRPAKQAYIPTDLQDWAAWWGVPFRFPSTFPVRTVLPLRAALVAPQATLPLYRALWVEDRDIGQPSEVAAVLTGLGLDTEAVLSQTQLPEIKAALRQNTQAAQEAGVCGVPTMQIDQGPMVWGQDRLDHLVRMLRGWAPAADRIE